MSTKTLPLAYKELKEALTLLAMLGQAIDKSINDDDKVLTLSDAPNFFNVLFGLKDAFEGVQDIPLELRTASPEESAELKEWVAKTFDITNDKVEGAIEGGIGLLLDLYRYFAIYFFTSIPVDAIPMDREVTLPEGTTLMGNDGDSNGDTEG